MDDKITIDLHEYMDRLLSNLRLEFDLKLSAMRGEMSALREEYKKSEKQVNEAKSDVDAHFDAVNNLQARMDKMSQTFLTSKDVDEKIKLAVANMSGLGIQVKVMWVLLTALILMILSLLAKEYVGG